MCHWDGRWCRGGVLTGHRAQIALFRFPAPPDGKRTRTASNRTESTFMQLGRWPRFGFREWGRHGRRAIGFGPNLKRLWRAPMRCNSREKIKENLHFVPSFRAYLRNSVAPPQRPKRSVELIGRGPGHVPNKGWGSFGVRSCFARDGHGHSLH